MCAQVSAGDFILAHHEVGHIYYFISYKNQPVPFREGASPAFLDATAALSALSARTVKYLNDIGLGPFPDSSGNENYMTLKVYISSLIKCEVRDSFLRRKKIGS